MKINEHIYNAVIKVLSENKDLVNKAKKEIYLEDKINSLIDKNVNLILKETKEKSKKKSSKNKRSSLIQFLKKDGTLTSYYAYLMLGNTTNPDSISDDDKGTLRSEFSKKLRGVDGRSFTDAEIERGWEAMNKK